MFGTLTGDLDELDRFTEKVGSLGGSRSLTRLNKALAEEAIVQARDGFREERDPYGAKWAKKVFPDGNKILRKSGKLYAGWYVSSVGPRGYTIANREDHAKFTFGTGLFGPRKRRIEAKGRALRIPGPVARGAGGRFRSGARYVKSVKGSPQRLIVPLANRPSPIWQRALKKRAQKFFVDHFRK